MDKGGETLVTVGISGISSNTKMLNWFKVLQSKIVGTLNFSQSIFIAPAIRCLKMNHLICVLQKCLAKISSCDNHLLQHFDGETTSKGISFALLRRDV